MDVELMCLMRHLRRSGRSAWGRGHPREKPAVDGGLGVSAGKLDDDIGPAPAVNWPGIGREKRSPHDT